MQSEACTRDVTSSWYVGITIITEGCLPVNFPLAVRDGLARILQERYPLNEGKEGHQRHGNDEGAGVGQTPPLVWL